MEQVTVRAAQAITEIGEPGHTHLAVRLAGNESKGSIAGERIVAGERIANIRRHAVDAHAK